MSGSTLVSTGELEKNLAHTRVFDCRHDLAKPALGEQQYRAGHIPGALFAHLDRDLSGRKSGKNGRHPLPEPGEFEKWLEKAGLAPKDQVVCYDAGNGSMAARLWWMLRWIGHDKVAVLDGGFAQWVKEGRPISVEFGPVGPEDGSDVSIAVRDRGIGMSPDVLGRIFDRFERAVTDREYGGFGLGLWIARQVVQAMDGTITAESEPGRGSTFTVRLPRGARPPAV